MSAKTWLKKAVTKKDKRKFLQRVLCSIMITNPVGLKAEFILGIDNTLADGIPRIYSKSPANIFFRSFIQVFPVILS